MEANAHRESWLAWILWSLVSLAMFAGFWFYFVLHRLLGLSIRQLVHPFVVLAMLMLGFALAAKMSRERFINRGQLAPMMTAVWSFLSFVSLETVYYAREFGYFNALFALVCYIVTIVGVPILAFLTFPIMRWFVGEFPPRELRGTDDQRNQSRKAF